MGSPEVITSPAPSLNTNPDWDHSWPTHQKWGLPHQPTTTSCPQWAAHQKLELHRLRLPACQMAGDSSTLEGCYLQRSPDRLSTHLDYAPPLAERKFADGYRY